MYVSERGIPPQHSSLCELTRLSLGSGGCRTLPLQKAELHPGCTQGLLAQTANPADSAAEDGVVLR